MRPQNKYINQNLYKYGKMKCQVKYVETAIFFTDNVYVKRFDKALKLKWNN